MEEGDRPPCPKFFLGQPHPAAAEKISRKGFWRTLGIFFALIGPGIITSNVDNDAGGITTYSLAGSEYRPDPPLDPHPHHRRPDHHPGDVRPHGGGFRQGPLRPHPRAFRREGHLLPDDRPLPHQPGQHHLRVCRRGRQPGDLRGEQIPLRSRERLFRLVAGGQGKL